MHGFYRNNIGFDDKEISKTYVISKVLEVLYSN